MSTPSRAVRVRSRSSPVRRVRVTTWQPARRLERTLTTRRLPFLGDPADLIARAARLVPQWRPLGLALLFGFRHTLEICFGTHRGVQTSVFITLRPDDVPVMMAYVARLGGELAGMMTCSYDADEGDGDEWFLPPGGEDTLVRMPTSPVVQ